MLSCNKDNIQNFVSKTSLAFNQKNGYDKQLVENIIYSFAVSYIIAKVLDKALGGIRVDEKEEIGGLDSHLHKESAYNFNS